MLPDNFETETLPAQQLDANCRFCRIVQGEVECYAVYEDQHVVAFLDHRPLFPGHCLIIPKAHHETIVDLPPSMLIPIFSLAQAVARALEETMMAEGTFVAINNHVSQSVPHLHVHVVPRRKQDGLKGFFWPRHPYRDQAHLLSVQQSLRQAIDAIRNKPEIQDEQVDSRTTT